MHILHGFWRILRTTSFVFVLSSINFAVAADISIFNWTANIADGVVSGVTSNYSFVELENTVEGAVSVAYMYDDCYYFHEDLYAVIGEQSGKKYQLGDKVTIKVLRCDKIKKTIDFSFVDDNIISIICL